MADHRRRVRPSPRPAAPTARRGRWPARGRGRPGRPRCRASAARAPAAPPSASARLAVDRPGRTRCRPPRCRRRRRRAAPSSRSTSPAAAAPAAAARGSAASRAYSGKSGCSSARGASVRYARTAPAHRRRLRAQPRQRRVEVEVVAVEPAEKARRRGRLGTPMPSAATQRRELARLAHDHVRAPACARARASSAAPSARTRRRRPPRSTIRACSEGGAAFTRGPDLGHRGLVGLVDGRERQAGAADVVRGRGRGATRTSCPAATQAWANGISGPMCPAPRVEAKRMRMSSIPESDRAHRARRAVLAGDPRPRARAPSSQRGDTSGTTRGRRPSSRAPGACASSSAGASCCADSELAWRVLETSHPPTIYVPPQHVSRASCPAAAAAHLVRVQGHRALPRRRRPARSVAWTYPDPSPGYEMLRDHVGVLPGARRRRLARRRARARPGGRLLRRLDHRDLVGPFKGARGHAGLVEARSDADHRGVPDGLRAARPRPGRAASSSSRGPRASATRATAAARSRSAGSRTARGSPTAPCSPWRGRCC